MLLGRMIPMALLRILFYLDRPGLLRVVAVLSKHMNDMAKHDVLWRLVPADKEDTQDMSGVAILAKEYELLEKAAKCGYTPPTDEQAAQGATTPPRHRATAPPRHHATTPPRQRATV